MTRPTAREQVHDAVRRVLSGIPGVSPGVIVVDPLPRLHWRVTAKAVAWSPGLHGMAVTWTADIGRHAAATLPILRSWRLARLEDTVRHHLDRHVTLQFARADRARALGIHAPLELPTAAVAASTPGSIRIDHLVVERQGLHRLIDSISRVHGTDGAARVHLDQQISFDAASAHETDLQGPTVFAGESVMDDGRLVRGVNVMRKLPTMMRELHTEEGTESLLQPTFSIGTGSTTATFDGSHLIILAPLPETILVAAVGRTVGEIAATGTDVDGRTILAAGRVGAATYMHTPVDAVRVRDLPTDIVTHAALDALDGLAG